LAKTIEWYKAYYNNNEIQTLQNINDYVSSAQKQRVIWAI